jgi:glycosyltransferase involved in cell wall biosynthesis
MSWAAILLNMDSVFFISELGKQEAIKAGLTKAEHLIVGVDTVFWHPATLAEKSQLRKGLGIGDDEFVVLTVADNQERKNLWAGMESIQKLKTKTDIKIRYILVTRPDSPVGWKLNDLSIEMGLTKELMLFNRGLPAQDLWGLYVVADVYLSTSKAEGLGMPVLEAVACGIPCVATDTGALHELLDKGRGYLIPPAYSFRDVWGNSKRDMIDTEQAAVQLSWISKGTEHKIVESALDDVQDRTWDIPVTQIHQKIEELFSEQK